MAAFSFDGYGGKLYRVLEGTVLEGVVTNHVDGGMTGAVLIMLTTDYYSHDHQQLLLPQGTRLIGTVQSVGNQQQHKLAVVFHRAVCPDGFSLDIDKYAGLLTIELNGTSSGYWSHQVMGASSALNALANIEAIDAASAQCLDAVGQYNQTRNANMPAASALTATTYNTTPGTNSELQQFNLLNMGQSVHVTEAPRAGQPACVHGGAGSRYEHGEAQRTERDSERRRFQGVATVVKPHLCDARVIHLDHVLLRFPCLQLSIQSS